MSREKFTNPGQKLLISTSVTTGNLFTSITIGIVAYKKASKGMTESAFTQIDAINK